MKRIYIFDAITKKDVTNVVKIVIGKCGRVLVFNSMNVDITDNVIFGIE